MMVPALPRFDMFAMNGCGLTIVCLWFLEGKTSPWPDAPNRASLLPNADAPAPQAARGVLFALFLIGATLQVRTLRARRA